MTSFPPAISGPNTALSNGCVRCVVLGGSTKSITFSCAVFLIEVGQKWEECLSINKSNGLVRGAYLKNAYETTCQTFLGPFNLSLINHI